MRYSLDNHFDTKGFGLETQCDILFAKDSYIDQMNNNEMHRACITKEKNAKLIGAYWMLVRRNCTCVGFWSDLVVYVGFWSDVIVHEGDLDLNGH